MGRFLFLCLLLMGWSGVGFGQKPVLSEYDLNHWPYVDPDCISNDGHYLAYGVLLKDKYSGPLYIRSLVDGYQQEVGLINSPTFTEDSREFLYLAHDSLGRLDLRTKEVKFISGVQSFSVPSSGGLTFIAYQRKDGTLVVMNRQTGRDYSFDHVEKYSFSGNGKALLIFQQEAKADGSVLLWMNLISGQVVTVWRGTPIRQYTMDSPQTRLAFLTCSDESGRHCSIRAFESGKDSTARRMVDEAGGRLEPGYLVGDRELHYSSEGDRLFFYLYRQADSVRPGPDAVKVDIWNYQDEYLQCDQLDQVNADRNRGYLAVVDSHTGKVLRLDHQQDVSWGESLNEGARDHEVLSCTKANFAEASLYPRDRSDLYLIDSRTGERTCIAEKIMPLTGGNFSPGGRYVVRYEKGSNSLRFYDLSERQWRTMDVGTFARDGFYGYGTWLEGDRRLLVYDKYDVWEVDPEGHVPPMNLSHGYGRRHGIYLRLVDLDWHNGANLPKVSINGSYILCAFDERTKGYGFYRMQIGQAGEPERLHMGRDVLYFSFANADVPDASVDANDLLLKARDTATYILMQANAERSANLVVTHDFSLFTPLTDVTPERRVNWLTSELVRWKTFDGQPGQGILYKPEDFDSTKKYPVIFYFYELLSGKLNQYISPGWAEGRMNIPWFVSRGYLVFCPDIRYKLGDPGKGIYNDVVSAAMMMKQKPWVDGRHMGMQGHSFGGYEVNYLVTRTGVFAAAAEAAGPSDIVSLSGEAGMASCSTQPYTEKGQLRMRVPLWQNMTGYLANSPVFGADKVTTPLLMLQCRHDGNTPWPQGLEFFTALRRLGKPCYMLQYDDGGHGIDGKDAVDYTRRLTQFFDHYLKGAPAPKWMVEGIPARLKGIDDGLELPVHDQLTGK